MIVWTRRELLGRGRGARSLELVQLFLAVVVSMGGRLGLAWASRGQQSRAGTTVHSAQAFMQKQHLAPPCQLSLQGLDLLPQDMVLFLQGLVLLVQSICLVCVLLPAALGSQPVLLLLLQLLLRLLRVCPSQQRTTPTELHGLGGEQRFNPVLGVPSAAVPSQCPLEAQGSGGSLNPQ